MPVLKIRVFRRESPGHPEDAEAASAAITEEVNAFIETLPLGDVLDIHYQESSIGKYGTRLLSIATVTYVSP